jgi:hypothetical protein
LTGYPKGVIIHTSQQGAEMIKYKVQIDMSEFGESAIWQDVKGVEFATRAQALTHIEWMQREYGEKIAYRAQPYAEYPSTPAYYEADGGSMWNGVGRSYTGW